ncbi:MAG: UDP-N-acetylmuramoyl-tripeptide--D-alanyl-D-alanine ligase [Chloroflexi bacterium]|nr:UDP-N-acetylmuramoyl-tripeptide--D-alanyl-D-alanine ligase [Chloroflexota bacterium]
MIHLSHVWRLMVGNAVATPAGLPDATISGFAIDSRQVQAGALFVALRGEKTDGHLYLQDAFVRGAIAAIAEPRALELGLSAWFALPDGAVRPPVGQETAEAASPAPCVFIVPDSLVALQNLAAQWRGQMPAVAIGITGSIGKTMTKETVANVLAQRFATLRTEGNLNNEIGLPLMLLRLTPEHQRVVLEMGMYALGEIGRLCELAQPRIGVVTNVGPSHLERMGSIGRIVQAKAELVQGLPPAAEGGVAILNADDPLVIGMAGLTRARVFTYGLNESSDLWADEIVSAGLEGINFRLHYGKEVLHLRLPILGRHSVHTALRGAAVGLVEGLSWAEIIAGLQDVRGQLRLMVVPGLRQSTLIDDTYNASPASVLAALNLLADITEARVEGVTSRRPIAVLGDMFELGSYEEEGHRLAGGRAAQVVQKLITVGARARGIADEALASGLPQADIYPTVSNADAIGLLLGLVRPGDVILVKGSRGMGMETIVDALSQLSQPGPAAERPPAAGS